MVDETLTIKDVKSIHILNDVYGDEVELEEGAATVAYRILSEFELGKYRYAVLQSDAMKKNEDYALYHIVVNEQGELELDTIMDDDEWEFVSELYDEMTVQFD